MPPVSQTLCDRLITSIGSWIASLDKEENNEQDVAAFQVYLNDLREFFEVLATEVAPRDKWEAFWSGSSVTLRSTKLSHDFTLDVDDRRGHLCLSSSLVYSQHLPKMTDEFWRNVLELHQHADVAFTSNRLDDKGKSIAWAIMCDHMKLASSAGEEMSDHYFLDAGTLELTWPLSKGMIAICEAAGEGFRRLYHLNYMLYRHEYIIGYSRQKRR